eukprot:290390-Chlamydomonas_euryale.AAC.1
MGARLPTQTASACTCAPPRWPCQVREKRAHSATARPLPPRNAEGARPEGPSLKGGKGAVP